MSNICTTRCLFHCLFVVHDLQLFLLPQHVHHRECAQWSVTGRAAVIIVWLSLLHHSFIVTANQALISFECYLLVLLCCIICLMLNCFFCLCTYVTENTETKLTKATRMWLILRAWFINSITYRETRTIKKTLTIGSLKCRSVYFFLSILNAMYSLSLFTYDDDASPQHVVSIYLNKCIMSDWLVLILCIEFTYFCCILW